MLWGVALGAFGKAKWGLALGAVVLAGLGLGRSLLPAPYRIGVPVDDAAGIYPGSDVMIGGAKVGSVDSVALRDGLALVTATIDQAHAPVHRDATVAVRPKSLLGERYLALDPGSPAAGDVPSGGTLPPAQASVSVDLQDVINTFDAPTRQKLQTAVVELGGGLAGRGEELNTGLHYGRQDLDDLSAVADTLARRDRELQEVIQDLSAVTEELARSDRRQQLSELIENTEQLIHNLAAQDARLKAALAQTNAALGRTATALDGTSDNIADLAHQLPYTVREGDLILADLGSDSDVLLPHLGQLAAGIQAGSQVFGGRDAFGYATRISLVAGCWTIESCPSGQVPERAVNVQPPPKGPPAAPGAPPPGPTGLARLTDTSELSSGALGFLLGTSR